MWRLVVERVATLSEIEHHWSLGDVLDANDALDVRDAAEALAHEHAKAKR